MTFREKCLPPPCSTQPSSSIIVSAESTRRVLSALTMLELDGYVAQSGGKRFSIQVELKE